MQQPRYRGVEGIIYLSYVHREIEPATLKYRRSTGECVRPEEDCDAEHPLDGSDEPPVLFPASLHPEALQHLASSPHRTVWLFC